MTASSRKFLRQTLTLAALGFVLTLVWMQRAELYQWASSLHARWAIFSILLLCGANIFAAFIFANLLLIRGTRNILMPGLISTFLFGQLGKYIPGRVWGVAQQVAILGGSVTPSKVIIVNFEVFFLVFAATLALGLVMLAGLLAGFSAGLAVTVLSSIALLALSKVQILSATFLWLSKFLPKKTSALLLEAIVPAYLEEVRIGHYFYLIGFSFTYAFGWFFLFYGGIGLSWTESLAVTTTIALSSVIGMVSLLPGGLGAREAAVIAFGSSLSIDLPTLASTAVASRGAMILLDLLLAGSAMPFLPSQDRGKFHE